MGTPVAHDASSIPEMVIRPPSRWQALRVGEIVQYRDVLYFLTKRELQIRYKQSIFGLGWAILQPVALAFIFALFFGRLASIPSDGVPYPVFALAGLVPWVFVSGAVTQASASLVADANLVSKVYFPRMVVPAARILSLLVDLAIATAVLLAFVIAYSVELRWTTLLLPAFYLLALTTVLGLGLLLAALNVAYRDIVFVVPLAVQVWLFTSPVVYPGSLVSGDWIYLYALNPMVTVLNGVRWALLGSEAPELATVLISVGAALAILAVGMAYFRRTELYFADVI
jgi:lipopolysaccharide transport system permease protein